MVQAYFDADKDQDKGDGFVEVFEHVNEARQNKVEIPEAKNHENV